MTTIEDRTFFNCALTSVTIPNSVTTIGRYAFSGCAHLTSVMIPNSVTTIEEYAFSHCVHLTSVIIPNSVTTIGESAFVYCSGLTSVTIPKSVTKIDEKAFNNLVNLKEINYDTTEPIEANKNIFGDNTYTKATLNVAVGGLDKAYSTLPWLYFANIKETDFSGIEDVIADLDPDAPIEVFNINGVKVADAIDNLPAGIYIIRQGKITKKVAVK